MLMIYKKNMAYKITITISAHYIKLRYYTYVY